VAGPFSSDPDDYGWPILASLILHSFLLVLITWGWQSEPEIKKIKTPSYVQAKLVQMTPKSAEKKKAPKQAKKKPQVKKKTPPPAKKKVKPKVDTSQQKKLAEQKKKQQQLEAEKKAKEKAEAEKRKKEQEQRLAAEQALAQALAEEDEFHQEQSDTEQAQGYAHLIKERVEQNWSRPPSAKYGMEVLLEIQLVPTGHVVGVSVLKSSGNAAFDLSAQQAVRKVERFIEIKDMPSRLFESRFRRFQMLFRPEDKLS